MKKLIAYCFIVLLAACKGNDAELRIARSEYDRKNIEGCKMLLLQYTERYPDDYRGWGFLGTIAIDMDNDSLADKVLSKALSLNPKDYKTLTHLGIQARKRKDYQQAADYYNKAIQIKSDYPKAYSGLFIIALKRKNFKRALELGEKAVELSKGKDLGIKGNLAVAYHFNNRFAERDALIKELTEKGYDDIEYINMLIEGSIKLDDVF